MRTLTTIIFLMLLASFSYAQSGRVDSSFGSYGIVSTDFIKTDDKVRKVAVQKDGKIVAAGMTSDKLYNDFSVSRYQKNGNLDSSFGSFGRVRTDISVEEDVCDALQIQPDGKILVLGHSYKYKTFDPLPKQDFILVRYKTNGSLDSTFGVNGKVITVIGTGYSQALSMALQPDGKIVAVGCNSDGSTSVVAIVRYEPNGSLDKTFNNTGIVTSDFSGNTDVAFDVYIQSDGKLLISGTSRTDDVCNFLFARYLSNGSLDNTFGTSGSTTTLIKMIKKMDDGLGSHVLRQVDGKYVGFGQYWTDLAKGKRELFVIRFMANGGIDNTFGTNGITTFHFDIDYQLLYDIALQADGKIVGVVRLPSYGSYPSDDIGLVRINANGTMDTTFGTQGKVTSIVGVPGTSCNPAAIMLQADNKIIVGGYIVDPAAFETNFLLIRYLSALSLGVVDFSIANPLLVYPNPIQQISYLEYRLDKTETISIRISDLQGNIVTSPVINEVQYAGDHKQIIQLPLDLPTGQYILSLHSATGVVSVKIIK